jgi:hypothetical protein
MDSAASSVLTALVEAGNIDTVYRDVYLDRAGMVLAPALSREDFHRLEHDRAALAELPLTIARAIDHANWSLVKELSERAATLKHAIDDTSGLLQTAASVYDVRDVRLDPFSPGLQPFTRIPQRQLATLRTRALGTAPAARTGGRCVERFLRGSTARIRGTAAVDAGRRCRVLVGDGPAGGGPTRAESGRHEAVGRPGRSSPRFAGTHGRHRRARGDTAPPLTCRCRPDPPRLSRMGWRCSRSTRS